MKYIGENAIKKLIALVKGDLAKKQNSITVSGLLKGDGTTISQAVAGTDYAAASHNHDSSYLKLSGGKLTGNLTGKYITGTWLQTTDTTALGSAATKICVLDSSGWVYYRTPEQIKSDIGAAAVSHVSDTNVHITGEYAETELQTIWDSAKVVTLVTFTITDTLDLGGPTGSFTAERGMTLTEWLASSYNTSNVPASFEHETYGTVILIGNDENYIKEGSSFDWSI